MEKEIEKLEATRFTTSPMEIYEMGKACIIGSFVETRSTSYWLGGAARLHNPLRKAEKFDGLVIANTHQGLTYFGHWLGDDCVAYEALAEFGDIRSMRRHAWPDCEGYQDLFEQRWQETSFATAERLFIQREIGFNSEKKQRFQLLRKRIRQKLEAPNKGKIVYLERGPSGDRRAVLNEEHLKRELVDAGVCIVSPEKGVEATISQLLDAQVIISVEGSQVTHGIFTLADEGRLLVLQPPRRFYNPHHEWTRLMGMKYGIVIGQDDETADGFHISPDETLRMVDRLLAA